MVIQKIIIFVLFCFLLGCSDYPSGYREGYAGSDKKQWVVFGRGDYLKGFQSGQAERFQDDWVLENPIEESLMQCPTIVVRADPLLFLPASYKEIGQNIYSNE